MSRNYVDTPGTERGDISLAQVPTLDFSIVQPFASPSKNPAEDLRNKMRGLRGGPLQQPPVRTPRLRSALLGRPNPAGPVQQEFTPLLRSAKRKELLRRSTMGEKENVLLPDIPPTPAGFRSSYGGDATQLPMDSSMLDEDTGNSLGAGNIAPHAVSSSMLSATPVPVMPRDGQVVVDQGNVLSLRDQEAKLDQIQKDNFGLKLKIHFLEEALRKTGSEYHQTVLKENAELKTERVTIDADNKRQKKRFLALEQELEEQRRQVQAYDESSRTHENNRHSEELEKLQSLAEESQRLADQRLQDMQELQARLEAAEEREAHSDELQDLRDDLQDLQREIRDRDDQLESKNEEVETLRTELQTAKGGSTELANLKEDVDDLEAELKEKEDELDAKNDKILALEQQLREMQDNAASTSTDLRQELDDAQQELKYKSESIDNAVKQIAELKERLKEAESTAREEVEALETRLETLQLEHASHSKQSDAAVQNAQRELADKDGEIRALQERLSTARGSWDAEAQQTDAVLQEKNRLVREKEAQLREKVRIIEIRDEELADLQRRLRNAESRQDDASQSQSNKIITMAEQIAELQAQLRSKETQMHRVTEDKEKVVEARSAELKSLQAKVHRLPSHDEVKVKDERIHELETSNRHLESAARESARKISSLERQVNGVESPSKKDALLKEQSAKIQALQKAERSKDAELDQLEREIEALEKENLALQQVQASNKELKSKNDLLSDQRDELSRKVERLSERATSADKDHSILGRKNDELGEKQSRIEALEDEIDKLESACKRHTRQTQVEVETLRKEHELDLAQTKQALEDEIAMLENALDDAERARDSFNARVTELEGELKAARLAKGPDTPSRERNNLRAKLSSIESERNALVARVAEHEQASKSHSHQIVDLKARIATLEADLTTAQAEKTIADERQDLHEIVKQSRIEVEELQLKLAEQRRGTSGADNGSLRSRLEAALQEIDEHQEHIRELEARTADQATREKQLRVQLREAREAVKQHEELEMQLGDRQSSSSTHARREAELRNQLRDAKIGLESLQQELGEKEDRILALMKREQALRRKSKRQGAINSGDDDNDATQILVDDLQAQLEEAEADILMLQKQLMTREKSLSAAHKRETELKGKIGHLRKGVSGEADTELWQQQRQHRRELKGLSKQIQLLHEKCNREKGFRNDLIYTKRWFLMQVEMYNECNQADLRLLEEMGITPDQTCRQRKPSLRALGLTVLATIKMQKKCAAWAENRMLQGQLVDKLDMMSKQTGRRKSGKGFQQ